MNLVFYILRRLAISIPILLIGSFLVFVMVAGAGDPLAELRTQPNISQESVDAIARELGLDKPLIPQVLRLARWIRHG